MAAPANSAEASNVHERMAAVELTESKPLTSRIASS
jgi:hypothetical protein